MRHAVSLSKNATFKNDIKRKKPAATRHGASHSKGGHTMRTKNASTYQTIYQAIKRGCMEMGYAPSIRAIEAETGISRATVQRHLLAMEEAGELIRDRKGRLLTPDTKPHEEDTKPVALLGEVACGLPSYAEENIEVYYRLPTSLTGNGDFYLLRAKGESMIEAGIEPGDLVLVRRQNYAEPGDIAVVLTEEETTLKRYYPEPKMKCVRLHPENRSMKDIYVRECHVQGVAIKVIKDL